MICARLMGRSVRTCDCMLPNEGGWLDCPEEARGILVPIAPPAPRPVAYAGEFCHSCYSPNMIRTGTCLTCADCGDSSGGCS